MGSNEEKFNVECDILDEYNYVYRIFFFFFLRGQKYFHSGHKNKNVALPIFFWPWSRALPMLVFAARAIIIKGRKIPFKIS